MEFQKLSSNSCSLLNEIVTADNPVDLLAHKLEKLSSKEALELKGMLRELQEKGYINVIWADDKPYHIVINNSAHTYEEMLAEYNLDRQAKGTQNITIGNNNKIKNSVITGNISDGVESRKKGVYGNHPVICSIAISFVVGFVLLFSFWSNIINFLEGLF